MNKAILLTFALAFIFVTVSAQKEMYLGVEGAVNTDVYDFLDNGKLLKDIFPLSGYLGLNIRQDLGSTVFLETGLLRKYYNEGIGFTTFSSYSSGNAINAWLIPLRLGTRINILKRKVYLVPVIGYTFGINSDYGYGDGGIGGFEIYKQDTIHFSMNSKLSLRRTFPLLQTGMGLEFMLFRTALLSVTANYYTGFKNLMEQEIEYTHNSDTYTASGLSKGAMMSFGIACKYPISSLWTKKER